MEQGENRRREAGMKALAALGIEERNPAAYGAGSWLAGGRTFASLNPATGLPIAQAGACTGHKESSVRWSASICAAMHTPRVDIDAPETRQTFGSRSKQPRSDLCFGKNPKLESQGSGRRTPTAGAGCLALGGWLRNESLTRKCEPGLRKLL